MNDDEREPCFDFILQRKKPLRLIVRRDMRERIHVVKGNTLNDWLINGKPKT